MNNPKYGPGFHHIALRAFDFEKTLQFYKDAFGYERRFGWGEPGKRAAMLGAGDSNFMEIFEGREAGDIPEGAVLHFAVRVADTDAVYQKALAAGATSVVEPKNVDLAGDYVVKIRIAFVKGLDGEVIELFHNDEL